MGNKILAMPDGNWLSHTSRVFEVARRLREAGHEVVFAGEGQYMRLPREADFRVVPVETLDPDRVLACSRSGRANWYDYPRVKSCVEAELAVFAEEAPDLVLGDFRLSLSTSCELAAVPLAVILNAAWTDYYTVRIRAPEHLAVTRIAGRTATSLLAPSIKQLILWVDSRPFNRFRRERGLPARRNIWDVWRGDLNLIVDIPEYGPTRDLPESFHYIGPILWEPDTPPPPWLDRLDPDRFTIYFTMGSTGYARFFEQAAEIFGGTDYQCVMTTAGMAELDEVPDNFFVADYAPGSRIMARSDVVVCHGGNGTIYQAMTHGVPIIGIPTMHDQEFNLDRVEDLGLGIHLSELSFRPEHLADAVAQIARDPRYKSCAAEYREILSRYDGPRTGAELISAYLQAVKGDGGIIF